MNLFKIYIKICVILCISKAKNGTLKSELLTFESSLRDYKGVPHPSLIRYGE